MFCKRLEYWNESTKDNKVLLGIIEKQDDLFIYFKTRFKTHQIKQKLIEKIEDTNQTFIEGEN